jgi:hypothetical protein
MYKIGDKVIAHIKDYSFRVDTDIKTEIIGEMKGAGKGAGYVCLYAGGWIVNGVDCNVYNIDPAHIGKGAWLVDDIKRKEIFSLWR